MASTKWLHPSVECDFPFLRGMMAQLPLTADRARALLDNEAGIDYQRLVQLSIQGIFCKQLFRCLYMETNREDIHQIPPTFNDVLWNMRGARLAFLVKDQDNQREILNRNTVWYLITPLCLEMAPQHPPLASTSGKEYLAIGWSAASFQPMGILNKMPWLAGLVHEFCHPGKIWTSTAMAGGTVKDIEMRLKFDGDNCDINLYWYPSNNFDENCVALMASSLLDAVKYNPVLKEFLEQGEIKRYDINGTLKDYNLAMAVNKAMDEFPTGGKEKMEAAKNHTGQAQRLAHTHSTNQAADADISN